MRIAPIKSHLQTNAPNFKANLHVERNGIILGSSNVSYENQEEKFDRALDKYDEWLKTDAQSIDKTMHIRKNTALYPKEQLVFRLFESYVQDPDPEKEPMRILNERTWVKENLEFEMDGKKCGFYFNPDRNEDELLQDFKNMFLYLLTK